MKAIGIEDAVFKALESRVKGFGETPNDVIKRLLDDSQITTKQEDPQATQANGKQDPIVELVHSKPYQWGDGKERYFAVLDYLCRTTPTVFEEFNGFRMGSRVQISKNKEEIENSGKSTYPQRLADTEYWVLSNLSHGRKRAILEIMLPTFAYSKEVIETVLKSIPDSNITRARRNILAAFA
jgi:negative regulator of replication initiation